MRLILCSEGFYTDGIVQACVGLCDKPQDNISVAVINEAFAHELGDKRWVLNNLNSVSSSFSGELDIINLLALDIDEVKTRIADKDVIFVVGGNSDYLMHVFDVTGFSELLPTLLEDKVYVGSSAGSMVMGRRLSPEIIRNIYAEEPFGDVSEYLGFLDYGLIPHLKSQQFPMATKQNMNKLLAKTAFPVYGLRDDSAIVVNGETTEIIGSEAYKIP